MLFKGLIVLFVVQIFLFVTGDVLVEEIQKKSRRIGNILQKAYIAISYIGILYAIIFLIYILFQQSGIYHETESRIIICALSILVVIVNISKLILLRKDFYFLFYYYVIGIIFIISITLVLSISANDYETVSLKREFVEEIAYQNIELVQINEENNTKGTEYDLAVIDCDNSTFDLELNNNIVNVTDSEKKYIQKYKVEETLNNIFESYKTEEYYEYIIYTPLESEKALVNFYKSNK